MNTMPNAGGGNTPDMSKLPPLRDVDQSMDVERLAARHRAASKAWDAINTASNWCDPDRREALLETRRVYQDATIALVTAVRRRARNN